MRHKTRKQPFRILFWATVSCDLAGLAWLILCSRVALGTTFMGAASGAHIIASGIKHTPAGHSRICLTTAGLEKPQITASSSVMKNAVFSISANLNSSGCTCVR